jgi:hypothetical protein
MFMPSTPRATCALLLKLKKAFDDIVREEGTSWFVVDGLDVNRRKEHPLVTAVDQSTCDLLVRKIELALGALHKAKSAVAAVSASMPQTTNIEWCDCAEYEVDKVWDDPAAEEAAELASKAPLPISRAPAAPPKTTEETSGGAAGAAGAAEEALGEGEAGEESAAEESKEPTKKKPTTKKKKPTTKKKKPTTTKRPAAVSSSDQQASQLRATRLANSSPFLYACVCLYRVRMMMMMMR